jgi:hypothetical protein
MSLDLLDIVSPLGVFGAEDVDPSALGTGSPDPRYTLFTKKNEQVLGTDRDYPIVVRDSRGQAITSYTAANPLDAVIWQGDALAALATPAIAWDDAAAGSCTLTIARADLLDDSGDPLAPGVYRLQAFVGEAGGVRKTIVDATIRLVATPGAGVAPRVYGTADEMKVFFPPIDDLQAGSDETGFAEQRARARQWADQFVERYSAAQDKTAVRAWLAADRLAVTPILSEMVAKKALSIVLLAQLPDAATVAAGRQSSFQQAGARLAAEAEALAANWVAEVDADGDGTVDTWVDCRVDADGVPLATPARGLRYGVLRARCWSRASRSES